MATLIETELPFVPEGRIPVLSSFMENFERELTHDERKRLDKVRPRVEAATSSNELHWRRRFVWADHSIRVLTPDSFERAAGELSRASCAADAKLLTGYAEELRALPPVKDAASYRRALDLATKFRDEIQSRRITANETSPALADIFHAAFQNDLPPSDSPKRRAVVDSWFAALAALLAA